MLNQCVKLDANFQQQDCDTVYGATQQYKQGYFFSLKAQIPSKQAPEQEHTEECKDHRRYFEEAMNSDSTSSSSSSCSEEDWNHDKQCGSYYCQSLNLKMQSRIMIFKAFFGNVYCQTRRTFLHQSTAASTWWCGPRPRLGWVEMAVGLPEGPSYPGHSPFIFSLCCPLNDRRRAAHSIFKIGRLFSLFLLSCPTLALLRLLILLLLLMSGNVHPNPGPIFPCSVCAGNVTWRGKSVQCCACSKWVHLRCSQLSLSNFRALGSSHSWSCPPCRNTVTPPPRTPPARIPPLWNPAPPLLMLHSRPTLVSKLLIPHLPILYLLPLPSHHRP